jgi:putative copper export protein
MPIIKRTNKSKQTTWIAATMGDQVMSQADLESLAQVVRLAAPEATVAVTVHDRIRCLAISGPRATFALATAGHAIYGRGYKWLQTDNDFAWLHQHLASYAKNQG